MAIMAQWHGKVWEVTPDRILAINGVGETLKLKTENNEDKEGQPATNVLAYELQEYNFDFNLSPAAGVNVRDEINDWKSLVGQCAPFYLGGRRFGPPSLQLTAVSLSDGTIDDAGNLLFGNIEITLTEYASEPAKGKDAYYLSTSPVTQQAPGVGSAYLMTTYQSAIDVDASVTDKMARKPQTGVDRYAI